MFDVIHVTDDRFPGGTSTAVAHEIRALAAAGLKVGLINKRAGILKKDRETHPALKACIDAGQAVRLNGANSVECRLAVLHNPYVFAETEEGLPEIHAQKRFLVGHQPILDGNGVPYFDVDKVNQIAGEIAGGPVVWAPISDLSRANMMKSGISHPVLDENWTNLIFVDDWACGRSSPAGDRPIIGRHSRPDWLKWPAGREEMLTIYPQGEEFNVRLLGVGDDLTKIMGEYPSNWTTFAFNEIAPEDFLPQIDFFVYFHHPDWVEGFGRTIAEGAASGAVVILPEHFRPTFGEAALYREPEEVLPTVREFHEDRERYMLQGQMGRAVIDRRYGPKPYLARIEKLLETPSGKTAVETPKAVSNDKPAQQLPAIETDVVILSDFRTVRETAWRIANESRIQQDLGYATALIHVPTNSVHDLPVINPYIDALVSEGIAQAVNPSTSLVRSRLLTIHQPHALFDNALKGETVTLPRIVADNVVVVYDRMMSIDDIRTKNALIQTLFGSAVWAPVSEALRANLLQASDSVVIADEIWAPSLHFSPWTAARTPKRKIPIAGRAGLCDETQWADNEAEILSVHPGDRERLIIRVLGAPHPRKIPLSEIPESWELFSIHEIHPTKFLDNLDFFVYFPNRSPNEVPIHALATAMANGVPAILSNKLWDTVGRGPIYAKPDQALERMEALHTDPEAYAEASTAAARWARSTFGPGIHKARLRKLAGAPARKPQAPAVHSRPARERVLFVSSNGVGLGHLTRLLSIARRMPGDIEPVFATMSQAMPIVEQAGYPVEYMPFHVYANCDVNTWNEWFPEHLSQIIDFHNARAVVFDGGNPYGGLLNAVAPRKDTKLVWVRRGMWRENQNNAEAIRRQRFFDLVIEPTDIAESKDNGATAYNRSVTVKVPPIRLLDLEEVPGREEAAMRLGLDPHKPAVLIQLGSGSNRDIVTMIDTVVQTLSKYPDIQPMIAEWMIAHQSLNFWPEIRRLRGFPISRFFNAFDVTISAAGYNSFNEIISFGLPAIFMANEHAMMDDQAGRARFAEEQGAGFYLPDSRVDEIGNYLEPLLHPSAQNLIRTNCMRISQENGAALAAQAIAELIS